MKKNKVPMGDYSRRDKLITVSTVAVLSGFLAYKIIIIPVLDKFRSLSDELSSRERRLRRGLALAQRRDDLLRQWRAMGEKSSNDSDDGGLMVVVSDIEKSAKQSGVIIRDLRPARTNADGLIAARPGVQLSMETDWAVFMDFLGRIQSSLIGLSIKSCHIQSSGQNGSILKISLNIERD